MYKHTHLHTTQGCTGHREAQIPPARPAEPCSVSVSNCVRQTPALPSPPRGRRLGEGHGRGRQPRVGAAPPRPQEGRTRRSEEAPPAGPSPPQGRPRPGRAAAEAEVGSSNAAPRGTRPGPTGAPRRGRRGWGRRAPPHLDLPTPLSPMMRIFRVVSTSSSIPSARPAQPGPTPTDAPCAGCGGTACACAPRRLFSLAPWPPAPRMRPGHLRCASGGGSRRKTPPPLRVAHARSRPLFVYGRAARAVGARRRGEERSGERPEVAARPCAGPAASGMSSAPVWRPQGGGDCPWVFSFC